MKYNRYVYVFLGGLLGGLFRVTTIYGISFFDVPFITSTLVINLLGAFLLGIIFNRFKYKENALIFITGCLGAFTTFSSLTLELSSLFERGDFLLFTLYLLVSMVLGLIMFIFGIKIQELRGDRDA
ncbi:MAG TPA: CrcB family protein [Candidatus Nosocomiicoccus stercorigallinarum]|nr:CrcB family protein [Candidatus Nosocomiicoccus stercorigallinarum]